MKTLRAFITALLLTTSLDPTFAGSGTITTKDAGGTTQTFDVVTDGSGNFGAKNSICDGTALASCLTITGGKALVTPDLPTGASTSALQTTGNTALSTINTTLGSPMQNSGGTVTVTQGTGTNLHAVLDSGTTTVTQATGTNLHSVIDSGTLTTVSTVTNLAQMNGVALLMGNGATGTGSQRVTIASDNTAFSVNAAQSGGWNITNISGTITLPTGAATSAIQTNASQKTQIVDGSGNVIAATSNNLNVQCANCSGSGVSTADAASFTAGASLFAGGGGFFQTVSTNNALTNLQQGMFQATANRAIFSNLRNASGTEVGTSAAELFVGGRGTAGSAAGGVLTVQGAASMTKLLVTPDGVVTQGSTTSGQSGNLVQCSVTTSAPTYTTAQTDPLNCDTAGNLRVNVTTATGLGIGSTTSGQTGSLVMGAASTNAPTATTGDTWPLSISPTSGGVRIDLKDSAANTNAFLVTGTGGTFPVSQATGTNLHMVVDSGTVTTVSTVTNLAQMNGAALLMGNGVTGTGSQRVTIASDNTAFAVNATLSAETSKVIGTVNVASGGVASGAFSSGSIASGAVASGAIASGAIASGAFASGSFLNATAGDPCMFQPKAQKNINTASGTTLLVSASGSTKVYICSFAVVAPSAVAVSLSEGTGATCNTANQAGIMGVAVNGTAANGMSLAANGGMTYGNGGNTVAFTATAGDAVCLFQSGTAQLAGNITYIQQ